MSSQNSVATPRNSVVVPQIRPEDLMAELSIKKDAYYEDLNFLSLRPHKDEKGKVYLDEAQANLLRALRSHVKKTGARKGFAALAQASEAEMTMAAAGEAAIPADAPQAEDTGAGFDEELLFREASEVAGSRITLPEQVVLQIANQMSYEDLHPETKAKVDAVRQAANPKFQAEQIATDLLSKWRQQRQQAAA